LDLEKARELVEHVLKVKLHAHESFYHDEDYYLLEEEDVQLILQRNYDCIDDEYFAEPEFPDVEAPILGWRWVCNGAGKAPCYICSGGSILTAYLYLRASPESDIQT
jgi:hypothetical protein